MDADSYAAKIFNYLGAGSAAISMAMARETGVLDVLLDADKPMTSQEVADAKQMKERYVRELLNALATAEVIQVDAGCTLYHVPVAFKPALRSTAPFSRVISHFGRKMPAVKQCFPKTGPKGVPFSSVPDIFDIMDDYRQESLDTLIEDDILAVVSGLKEKLENGIVAAEFGCATGKLVIKMASMFPASSFTGSDIADDVLETARKTASDANLCNVSFQAYDLYNLPADVNDKFDWICVSDVVHDLAYPDKALAGIYRALKPGGTFSMLDLCCQGDVAQNAGDLSSCFLYTSSLMVCLPESCCHDNSAELGPAWQTSTARDYLETAGFRVQLVFHSKNDGHSVHFVCEK